LQADFVNPEVGAPAQQYAALRSPDQVQSGQLCAYCSGEQAKLQQLNVAFGQENKAVNGLQNLKASHACDAY
jgi:hypothetical protein